MNLKSLFFMAIFGTLFLASKAEDKPNIIFILTDDLGYGDVGFNGQSKYATPAIDQLAAEITYIHQALLRFYGLRPIASSLIDRYESVGWFY